jgi:hypothetical protein
MSRKKSGLPTEMLPRHIEAAVRTPSSAALKRLEIYIIMF